MMIWNQRIRRRKKERRRLKGKKISNGVAQRRDHCPLQPAQHGMHCYQCACFNAKKLLLGLVFFSTSRIHTMKALLLVGPALHLMHP
jgi:hypothetical protein